MIIPVRCYSCGKVVGNKWTLYEEYTKTDNMSNEAALDLLELRKYCCRRMILSHVNLIDRQLLYSESINKKIKV